MKTIRRERGTSSQRGIALFLGLIFLLMITLVAVTAMRGTSLELNMANNTANHEMAFEGAESGRMAFVRVIRDHWACSFAWAQGASLTSSGGGACVGTSCDGGDSGDGLGNKADYRWEPRLTIDDPALTLEVDMPSQNPSDPTTYVDRFTLNFATDGVAHVGANRTQPIIPPGENSSQHQGAEGPNSARSSVVYVDVTSKGNLGTPRANVGGHYRLILRDAAPETCETNLTYGS